MGGLVTMIRRLPRLTVNWQWGLIGLLWNGFQKTIYSCK